MPRLLLACCLALAAVGARAAEVRVAVAANFSAPMQKIAAAFEQATGHRAVLSIGSTGRFYAQVRNGAPFHLLLAADQETPARLEQEGLAVAGSRWTYATGRLVLWSATPGLVDPHGAVLRQGGFQRLAIADPKLAPYGAAAMQVLERLALRQSVQHKVVQGESIAQTYQFAASGNAQLAFVALAQVQSGAQIAHGSGWLVPATLHAPIRQQGVLLTTGKDQPAAKALLAFLQSEAARTIIRAHGYEL